MIKKSISLLLFITFNILNLSNISAQHKHEAPKAKYVFYFIGDGMGLSHVSLAEAFLAAKDGKLSNNALSFTQFPVFGMVTTFSASNIITDSSAAGTALSCGEKTTNGMLGVRPDSSALKSITYNIHKAGFAVGISSSVTIDHATPAAFYASSYKRSDYYEIAEQLPKTGFEFFGGGGFLEPKGKNNDRPYIYDAVSKAGYTIARGTDSYEAKKKGAKKMFYTQAEGIEKDLPYAIDRKEGDLTLPKVVTAAIDFLYRANPNGFFLMSEGGKIDWAAHANDGKTDILEVIDFSNAIAVAMEFYKQHPNETLIIVTADHETGGLSLGDTKGYTMDFSALDTQKNSIEFDKSTTDAVRKVNKEAKIGWTTSAHSGTAVPVFAIGAGSRNFGGRMDNTEIPKKICAAMGVAF